MQDKDTVIVNKLLNYSDDISNYIANLGKTAFINDSKTMAACAFCLGQIGELTNDICYAGELQQDIRVTEAKPLRDGMMLVTFSTGEKRLLDTRKLEGAAFRPLTDEDIFNRPVLFHGVITWDDGKIDIAPETVYRESYAYCED